MKKIEPYYTTIPFNYAFKSEKKAIVVGKSSTVIEIGDIVLVSEKEPKSQDLCVVEMKDELLYVLYDGKDTYSNVNATGRDDLTLNKDAVNYVGTIVAVMPSI